MVCSQIRSRLAKFSICIDANSPLGMDTTVRASVRTRVDRSPISSTVPIWLPNRQKSPTCTGWSATSEAPPNRCSTVFWAASASAMPPTPSPAMSAVTWTPSTSRSAKNPSSATRSVSARWARSATAILASCCPCQSSRTLPPPTATMLRRSQVTATTATISSTVAKAGCTASARLSARRVAWNSATAIRRRVGAATPWAIRSASGKRARVARPWISHRAHATRIRARRSEAGTRHSRAIHCHSAISSSRTSTNIGGRNSPTGPWPNSAYRPGILAAVPAATFQMGTLSSPDTRSRNRVTPPFLVSTRPTTSRLGGSPSWRRPSGSSENSVGSSGKIWSSTTRRWRARVGPRLAASAAGKRLRSRYAAARP